MSAERLSREQEEHIRQVAATMSVENMPLTEEASRNLHAMACGAKTAEQVIAEITTKYKREA